MTDAKVLYATSGVGRLGTAAAWISAVCCLPYLFLKVVWTLDIPVGITDRSVLDSSGWVAGNAVMAVIELAGLLLVLALVRPWARRVPAWILLFPVWVGTGLLFEIVVGAALAGLFSSTSQASSGTTDLGGFQPWVFVLVYSSFAGQGVALAIAFASHVRARWGRLLGQRTGEVAASRTSRVRSWPETHLAEMAEALAAMAIGLAAISWYWAAGGSFGLSNARPHPTWALLAAGVAGAAVAAVGLLGLAGRWGQRTRFWLPVALTWLGSGAVAAFDGLNQLFLIVGLGGSDTRWTPVETVVMLKVMIGLLAGAVGVLAVATAAKDNQRRAGTPPQTPSEREEDSAVSGQFHGRSGPVDPKDDLGLAEQFATIAQSRPPTSRTS
jgi:hypothetical protein